MKNKKKNLLIITLIFIIILLSVQLILNKTEITNKKTKRIKEMSESEQVTDLNNQINSLNIEHTQYMNYIQTCKTAIATALTNEGVEISDQATFETMAGDISKVLQERTKDATATEEDIVEGKIAYVNGERITGTMKSRIEIGNLYIPKTNTQSSSHYITCYVDIPITNNMNYTTLEIGSLSSPNGHSNGSQVYVSIYANGNTIKNLTVNSSESDRIIDISSYSNITIRFGVKHNDADAAMSYIKIY